MTVEELLAQKAQLAESYAASAAASVGQLPESVLRIVRELLQQSAAHTQLLQHRADPKDTALQARLARRRDYSVLRQLDNALRQAAFQTLPETELAVFRQMLETSLGVLEAYNGPLGLAPATFLPTANAFEYAVRADLAHNAQRLSTPIRAALQRAVALRLGTESTLSMVEAMLVEYEGRLAGYAQTIAYDALMGFDGAVSLLAAQDAGLDAYRYIRTTAAATKKKKPAAKGVGPTMSRPQCLRWMAKGTLHKAELADEIGWAYAHGKGMKSGTTPDTFVIDRGGYHCQHCAIPVRSAL